MGGFHLRRIAGARGDVRWPSASGDRWGFVIPGGESYALLQARVGAWYESLERDTRGRRRMAACAAC